MNQRFRWLNYHHLLYFYMTAKEGSVTKACKELRLSQPTVSAQLKALEESLGERLFEKEGRHLKLTEVGRVVYRYAEEIFGIGRELLSELEGRPSGRTQTLKVGISDVMPKEVVYRLLTPVLTALGSSRLVCHEGHTDRLLAELAVHDVDMVISDSPIRPNIQVKAFNHFLGESGLSFLGADKLAKQVQKGFPGSLAKVPLFLPSTDAAVRRELDRWFKSLDIVPNVVGEFQDSALMKSVAQAGTALFPLPTCVEKDVTRMYDYSVAGRTTGVRERFYVISVERRVKHPAVVTIVEEAQKRLFTVGT